MCCDRGTYGTRWKYRRDIQISTGGRRKPVEASGLLVVKFNQNSEGHVGFSQVKKGRGHSQQRD